MVSKKPISTTSTTSPSSFSASNDFTQSRDSFLSPNAQGGNSRDSFYRMSLISPSKDSWLMSPSNASSEFSPRDSMKGTPRDSVYHQTAVEPEVHQFTFNELNSFCLQEGGFKKLKQCFFYDNVDAFRHFCSLIIRGKEFSHPSKRRRREAYLDLFSTLSGYTASKIYELQVDAEELKATYDNISVGLQSISERWKKHPIDAIYSLCMLIDFDSNGYATWTDFFDFMEGIEDSTKHKALSAEKALMQLYRDLRDHTKLCAYGGFHAQDLANEILKIELAQGELLLYSRIAEFVTYTRKLGYTPLKDFCQLIQVKGPLISVDELVMFFTGLGAIIKNEETIYETQEIIPEIRVERHIQLEDNFDYENVNETIELLRINANKISEKLTSQTNSTDPNILNALKNIEEELSSFGQKIASNGIRETDTKTNSSGSISNIWEHSANSFKENNSPAEDNLASRRGVLVPDKLTIFNNKLSPRVSFIGTPDGGNLINKLSEGSINITPLSTSPNRLGKVHNRRLSLSNEKQTISLLNKVTTSSTPSPGASSRADLSIFRSPLHRQHSGNKNVYDNKTYAWSATKKTNKYNERFQTEADLINQSKLNSLLGYN